MAERMFNIPEHPQPGFYETTVIKRSGVPKGRSATPYTHVDYEAQRGMRFGEIEDLKEAATLALLDKGWVPSVNGGLVLPEVKS